MNGQHGLITVDNLVLFKETLFPILRREIKFMDHLMTNNQTNSATVDIEYT